MRVTCFAIALALPTCVAAQSLIVIGSNAASGGPNEGTMQGFGSIGLNRGGVPAPVNGIGSIESNLRIDPPGSGPQGLTSSYHGRNDPMRSYFTRTVIDTGHSQSTGYEVLLEEQKPGEYLATFGKATPSPLETSVMVAFNRYSPAQDPVLPQPKLVHDGDVISVELLSDPDTGQKLFDDIKIGPYVRQLPTPTIRPVGVRLGAGIIVSNPALQTLTTPTVDGTARDFGAADAEMRLVQPRITINGTQSQTAALPQPVASGSLLWIYLPNHGRYVLSLAPHPELEFRKAGEVRGGSVSFAVDGDSIALASSEAIASGHSPYTLYVLHDSLWEPTASSQKGRIATGSVDAGELAKLKNQ